MIQRKAVIIITICIFYCMSAAVYAVPVKYKDVKKNHWAEESVYELAERNILEGYGRGTVREFKGEQALTRYEFAVALLRAIHQIEAETGATQADGSINADTILKNSNLAEQDVELIQSIIQEFEKELTDLNNRVSQIESRNNAAGHYDTYEKESVEDIDHTDIHEEQNKEMRQKSSFYLSLSAVVLSLAAVIIAAAG